MSNAQHYLFHCPECDHILETDERICKECGIDALGTLAAFVNRLKFLSAVKWSVCTVALGLCPLLALALAFNGSSGWWIPMLVSLLLCSIMYFSYNLYVEIITELSGMLEKSVRDLPQNI